MSELERALYSNDINLVKKVISDMEYEYYTVDNGEELKDYFEDFEYIVPNYDTLLKAMGIDDNQEPTNLIFNTIKILPEYTGREENIQKEIENAVKLYSLSIDLIPTIRK